MINLLSIVLLGFFLGMRHATDPDHVLAVGTIVSRERRIGSAMLIGALWGVGHTVTILVVGGAIIVFDVVIPPRLGLSMEFSVAVMLIVLGALNLTGIMQWLGDALPAASRGVVHTHPHSHGALVHTHTHRHDGDAHDHVEDGWRDGAVTRLGFVAALRPLVVGVVHGLAGSAAIALLVLTTIPSGAWAVLYLIVFGVGTIVGMMLITAANAVPFAITARRFAVVHRSLGIASGVLSMGFGLFLAYRIGIVDGLFSSVPQWTPQ